MPKRLRIGVLYGGRSGEHEVSLRSAIAVIAALDPTRYEIVPIAITRRGRWFSGPESLARLHRAGKRLGAAPTHGDEVAILPEPTRRGLSRLTARSLRSERLDVVFPVLHGTFGEDGTIQGLLELAGLPYVGAGVLASAVAMDKDVMKRLLRDAGLPIVPFLTLRGSAASDSMRAVDQIAEAGLGYPVFVKPANLGSSVGISKVSRAEDLPRALQNATRYDTKVVIEEAIVGRELEIAVIGNTSSGGDPIVSVPGEIIPGRDFYDYVDKYVGHDAQTYVPAHMTDDRREEITDIARRAYGVLECDGMARVDFFLRTDDGRLLVNEINTIPGCTPISLFPRMWEASGLTFRQVVDRLVALALERHSRQQKLQTSFRLEGNSPRRPPPSPTRRAAPNRGLDRTRPKRGATKKNRARRR